MTKKIDAKKVCATAKLKVLHADVLVIGGGYAGCFAAIRAAEAGQKVIMAVKGRAGRSGLSPWANSYFVYHETQGVTREDYIKQFELSGEYLANMDYVNALIDESYDRHVEMVSWGATEGRMNYYQPGTLTRSIEVIGCCDALRHKTMDVGVELLERVMMTSLIKPGDKVEGAMGFHMESGQPYAVLAKSTVICTGPSSLKPLGYGFPCSSATSDGDAMAYRVGAEIAGKEFNDAHPGRGSNHFAEMDGKTVSGDGITKKSPMELGGGPGGFAGPVEILHGDVIGMRIDAAAIIQEKGLPLDPDVIVGPGMGIPKYEGYRTGATNGAPVFDGEVVVGIKGGDEGAPAGGPPTPSGYSTIGMSNHKAEGLFPHDAHGKSNLEGLWAAGDSLSTMQNGAGYAGFGCSSAGSAVQGHRAGIAAATAAQNCEIPVVDEAYLEGLKAEMFRPITTAKGFNPAWMLQLTQNIMYPYFIMLVKEKRRLEAALFQLEYLQERFANELLVEDFHGLRDAHEARNVLLNAEMKLRAGLAREESRGTHIREDFPYRDDENFLCWMKLVKGADGKMQVVKHPVPEVWHPATELTYREKYPCAYPGEDEYLSNR